MVKLEEDLKQVRNKAEEADKQYDEVSKKLQITEGELEKVEERGEMGETKIMELEEELKVVANNLKSLEVSEEKANQREIANKEQVKNLTTKLKQAEARAEEDAASAGLGTGGGVVVIIKPVSEPGPGHQDGTQGTSWRDKSPLLFHLQTF